ncbi:hypothetical protein IG631_06465 [Alternaria alternata]|nr:hypothetical protein IG631_06465 [Alternaria alternata]
MKGIGRRRLRLFISTPVRNSRFGLLTELSDIGLVRRLVCTASPTLLSLEPAPDASLDGVIDGNSRSCGGSACSRPFVPSFDWFMSRVRRNMSALKHADPCMMHGLIAWLSSTKLCGANKCLTKSRNKLRQAATEKLGCECIADRLCRSVRSYT